MPLLPVDLSREGPAPGTRAALAAALAALPAQAPVVVMIHGFRFSPRLPALSPHRHILSLDPAPGAVRALSWPRALGLGAGRADEGLAIALGWESRGNLWRAWAEAAHTGAALARLLAEIARLAPERPVAAIAHSLGARLLLAALPLLPAPATGSAGGLRRLVLLAPAEFRCAARRALASPAGTAVEVLNVTSRSNLPFDAALELALAGGLRRSLGHGLPGAGPGWADLPLDRPDCLARLAAAGYRIAPPERAICHWAAYLRPGVFPLYRAFLEGSAALAPRRLNALLAPPAEELAPGFALSGLPQG